MYPTCAIHSRYERAHNSACLGGKSGGIIDSCYTQHTCMPAHTVLQREEQVSKHLGSYEPNRYMNPETTRSNCAVDF